MRNTAIVFLSKKKVAKFKESCEKITQAHTKKSMLKLRPWYLICFESLKLNFITEFHIWWTFSKNVKFRDYFIIYKRLWQILWDYYNLIKKNIINLEAYKNETNTFSGYIVMPTGCRYLFRYNFKDIIQKLIMKFKEIVML